MEGFSFAGASADESLQSYFGGALAIGASVGLGEKRYGVTLADTDVINGMTAPTTSSAGQAWGGVWDRITGAVGKVADTELSRYAARRAYEQPIETEERSTERAARGGIPPVLMVGGGVLLLGVVAWLALRK